MAVDNEARIWAVLGQSGTGKGLWIKRELKRLKPKRIIILDPMDEYGAFAKPVGMGEMSAGVIAAGTAKPFAYRYVFPAACNQQQLARVFDHACKLAYAAQDCAFLVEELSLFTTPSWAPPTWARMCNSGRHQGVWVIGCSQFPAQVDKSFLSNATMVHTGWLAEEPHQKAVARRLGIKHQMIQRLPDLHYLEWHRKDRLIRAGQITVTGHITEKVIDPNDEKATPERAEQTVAAPKIPRRGRRTNTGGAKP